jgi:hypothetical protein
LKKYAVLFLILVSCSSAAAYTRITTTTGQLPKWSSMPVSFWINEKGSAQIFNGSDFSAVRASFQTWENVQQADIRFNYMGTTTVTNVGRDGLNIVSFSDTSGLLGSSTIAATFSFFKVESGQYSIEEADIVFNTSLEFSTSAEENKFDIQSVLTHEIGHLLGLDHSAMISSVMVPFGAVSQLSQRTLAYDDIAGVVEIYPKTFSNSPVGQIRGTIRSGATTVFGANVVAVDSSGTAMVSTLSQPNGAYILRFLPPGEYRVYAEPLDLPVTRDHISGGSMGFYGSIRTDFGSTYFGDVSALTEARPVTVAANDIATADIQTLPKSATSLNLTRPGFAVRVSRGNTSSVTMGGEGLTAGVAFSVSNSDLILSSPTFGGRISSVASTSARMNLSVSLSTSLGPKNLAVSRGADESILSGAFIVTDTPPSSIAANPGTGSASGGSLVTITGSNFRPDAQVYFGGLAATSVQVVDAGTILVTTPANAPGGTNVVVTNSDGTWGVASQAFKYLGEAPVITRVMPLSAPPTATVIIEGDHFDTRTQNVTVSFNGRSARIVNSTQNRITTIVPFGATTGPLTVSVFSVEVTGPVFDVASGSASTNVASPVFNFIDATPANGGQSLTFNNSDDAVSFATLPFNFSLFQDIYLAGARLSVTTNGFLSLETLGTAEFQNGSLPGLTVTRPGGSTGTIPASMIAPFWDDLVLKSNSVVATKTIGDAPNRQFVVEWANMGILNDDGRDLNANITFEAILFEGSNDIQFVYGTRSGAHSDGSSATIGAQDLKRVHGLQSSFNQSIVSTDFVLTYRFNGGAYAVAMPDPTPPAKPFVTDEGPVTSNKNQLAASWSAVDPESGIREFQYAIGTTAGATDVLDFTRTTFNSAIVTGLSLQQGITYYFAVKALNGAGAISELGVSDGILFDATFQSRVKIIPSSPQSGSEFSGIALLAPIAMTVVLRAYDATGNPVLGNGIRNPATIALGAGQQYAKVIPELFGIQNFDGWIEVEAPAPGPDIFTTTGTGDLSALDALVPSAASKNFVLFHNGASAIFVNPSTQTANATMTMLGTSETQSFSVPARGRIVRTLSGPVRVQSSEALVALERLSTPSELAMNSAASVTEAQATLVFPQAVVGGGYSSTLNIANISGLSQTLSIRFDTSSTKIQLGPNAAARVTVPAAQHQTGLIRITTDSALGAPVMVGVLDIENEKGMTTLEARPAAKDFIFPYVVNGNGLYTGVAFAAGDSGANISIEVFGPNGGVPKSGTVTLGPNQQAARFISDLVPSVTAQMGGYIRIHSDQPVWGYEIYGSHEMLAAGPPL